MELFHHITVFFLDQEEKKSLVKAGVVIKTVAKGSCGENATFEIAENDPNWPRVEAFLSSMGDHRVRDFSTTVPMDRNYSLSVSPYTRAISARISSRAPVRRPRDFRSTSSSRIRVMNSRISLLTASGAAGSLAGSRI